jgi:methyl-accepting chemotaxis protein
MQQALVAERSLMFMNVENPKAKEQVKAHNENLAQVKDRWKKYTLIPADDEAERKLWPIFEAAVQEWEAASREVIKLLLENTPDARRDAIDLSLGEAAEKFDKARNNLDKLTDMRLTDANHHATEEAARVRAMRWWAILSIIGAMAAALVSSFILARSIARPMGQTVELLKDIAQGEGDLTKRLDVRSQDEIGELARWFNTFMDKLEDIIARVSAATAQVAAASEELTAAGEQMSSAAQQQASSLEETAASLEEITGTVKQNADNARQANQLAIGSRDTAEKGGEVVTRAVSAMGEINKSSKKITDIITTIDEIAFQTNLLALNAAVEAARAGEQGRGFAVVAAEVRSLAQRSATAAKEIKALIQDSVQKVQDGSDLVTTSGQTLHEIVSSVKKVTDIIGEIAAASQEQSGGIDQVNKAVSQMDQVVQSNAAHTEELSSTAQSLTAQAQQLRALVGQFKLDQRLSATQDHQPAIATKVIRGTVSGVPFGGQPIDDCESSKTPGGVTMDPGTIKGTSRAEREFEEF